MQPWTPVIISAAGRGNSHLNAQLGEPWCEGSVCVQLRTPEPSWIWAHCDTKQGRGSYSAISAGEPSSPEIILHSFRYSCAVRKADYESHTASATLPSQGERKIDLQLPMGLWSRWRSLSWDPLQLVINCTVFLQTSIAWHCLSNLKVGNLLVSCSEP